jgi:2-oxoglutarate ferredoxin oxidoreductase subunit alpha
LSEEIENVVIRLAGDSGDGMQLTGNQFTAVSALAGNDLATLPDFPAEIRAPAGTMPGVSAFQVHISSEDISHPGDQADVLVAMNPAALRSELSKISSNATVIVNTDGFGERDLAKAGYEKNPLEDGTLEGYHVIDVPMTSLTVTAVTPLGVKRRDAERSKNFFALGLLCWMYSRDPQNVKDWINRRFASDELIRDANTTAFDVGHAFGETTEQISMTRVVAPADHPPGTYRNINGNTSLAWGMIAASQLSGLPGFLGSYPITPASDILHELSKHAAAGIRTFQAEDEIAAATAAIGAAFAGQLAWTTTSGPGIALKGEAMGLAISLELPLVIVNIQRGGPSTGLPTKTEQSDLLQALYGRHGESPMPVIAARRPSDCFECAIEAARVAIKYRTPVMLLSDGFLANSSEPWRIPDVADLPDLEVEFATEPNHENPDGSRDFWPYLRDETTLARPWAVPGTPGLEHRIGGLEKQDGTGDISYDPENHQLMTRLRAEKVARVADDLPPPEFHGPDDADVLVVGWGSTWGTIRSAVQRLQQDGMSVAHMHLRHLNPMATQVGEILKRHRAVVVPEMNMGQLSKVLRAEFLVDAQSLTKVAGLPFTVGEIEAYVRKAGHRNEGDVR